MAQTGSRLKGLGEVPLFALEDVLKKISQADLDRWSIEGDTATVRPRHLGPTVRLSKTPPYRPRPSVPLGNNEPVWPARVIEIVKRIATGFEVLPRRWVVERTLAWLNRNRRLARDFEATLASATTWLYIASVNLLIRRLSCL